MAKIGVHKIWVMNFSQFWTVFPSFGREKLGKTGLSHFGREKQVLDGKNPTLSARIPERFPYRAGLPNNVLDSI